jgi:hypothetical protein
MTVTRPSSAHQIRDNPPTIFHWREELGREEFFARVLDAFTSCRDSLLPSLRVLLDRFAYKAVASKVVGVASVGTLCGVVS